MCKYWPFQLGGGIVEHATEAVQGQAEGGGGGGGGGGGQLEEDQAGLLRCWALILQASQSSCQSWALILPGSQSSCQINPKAIL